MHPLVLGAVGQRGEAGKGKKAKILPKSCGLGEGCSVVHVVGCEGAGGDPEMGLCARVVPPAMGTRVSEPASPCRTQSIVPGRFSWLFKVGQAETQGASVLTNLKPATSKAELFRASLKN